MKKLLALALAAVMVLAMGVTAFADHTSSYPEGDDADDYSTDDLALGTEVHRSSADSDLLFVRIYVRVDNSDTDIWNPADDGDLEDVTLRASVTDGKSYVEDIYLDELEDEDRDNNGNNGNVTYQYAVFIELKDYYEVDRETIRFELTLRNDRGRTIDEQDYSCRLDNTDGWTDVTDLAAITEEGTYNLGVEINSRGDEVYIDYADFTAQTGVYYADQDETRNFDANVVDFEDMEYLELNADYLSFGVRLSDQGELAMAYNARVDKDVARMFDDSADLVFINFPGRPTFDFTGEAYVYLPDEDEDWWLYEIDEDGDITEVNTSLSDDDDALVFKTRTLGCYVLSDYELDEDYFDDDVKDDPKDEPADKPTGGSGTSGSTNDPNKGNPTTGSSDYVGVAVTLAVVSLAAAGAVTLKRKK